MEDCYEVSPEPPLLQAEGPQNNALFKMTGNIDFLVKI